MSAVLRGANMLKASFVGDAAAMPLHWIYDQTTILDKLATHSLSASSASSAFFPTPSCPYYAYPAGVLSPYGDEALPFLRAMHTHSHTHAHSDGERDEAHFDREAVSEQAFAFFSQYDQTGEKGYAGRLNHVSKHFVQERKNGKEWTECATKDDSQANGIAKVPLIVARYAGSAALPTKVEEMVRVLQDNALSVQASLVTAAVLERVLLQDVSPSQAVEGVHADIEKNALASHWAFNSYQKNLLGLVCSDELLLDWVLLSQRIDTHALAVTPVDAWRSARIKGKLLSHYLSLPSLRDLSLPVKEVAFEQAEERELVNKAWAEFSALTAKDASQLTFTDVAKAVGLSCSLPSALLNSLFVMRKAKSLVEAVHVNNLMAGDNCSRVMVIAAAFGATGEAIPDEWISSVKAELWSEISAAADKIATKNPALSGI